MSTRIIEKPRLINFSANFNWNMIKVSVAVTVRCLIAPNTEPFVVDICIQG